MSEVGSAGHPAENTQSATEETPIKAAIEHALAASELKARYVLLAILAAVTWWQAIGAFSALRADPAISRARSVRGTGQKGQLEVVVTDPILMDAVTAVGAALRTAVADPTGLAFVVEAPAGADTRSIVDHVSTAVPSTTLVAHRERDRSATVGGHQEGVLERLTDRQREALEAAYRAGYFEWPRESTAEEVATSLDIAAATLHGHLRKAELTMLETLFNSA